MAPWRGAVTITVLTVGATIAAAQVQAADVRLLAGAGIYRYTDGFALQLSTSVFSWKNVRASYTRWNDNSALVASYEWRIGRFNVSPGAGYLSSSTPDTAQRFILQAEVGWQITERWRCQLTHFSSPPHDHGENFAFCGLQLPLSPF